MHHRPLDGFAVKRNKVQVTRAPGVKFAGPGSIEIDSVQQVHPAIGMKFTLFQEFWYHAVGMCLAPIVDFVHNAA